MLFITLIYERKLELYRTRAFNKIIIPYNKLDYKSLLLNDLGDTFD